MKYPQLSDEGLTREGADILLRLVGVSQFAALTLFGAAISEERSYKRDIQRVYHSTWSHMLKRTELVASIRSFRSKQVSRAETAKAFNEDVFQRCQYLLRVDWAAAIHSNHT